jgi:hypothetical protein
VLAHTTLKLQTVGNDFFKSAQIWALLNFESAVFCMCIQKKDTPNKERLGLGRQKTLGTWI